jgi:hypothetical protein
MYKAIGSLTLLGAVLLAGCTTPLDKATVYYDRAGYAAQVASQNPEIVKPVLQHGRCNVVVATPGSNVGGMSFCTYALTDDGLSVLGWDAKTLHYTEIVQLKWADLKAVSLENFGLTRQVQFVEAQRQTGLSAIIDDGGYVDRDSTQKLFDYAKGKGIHIVEADGLMKGPQAPTTFVPIIIPR